MKSALIVAGLLLAAAPAFAQTTTTMTTTETTGAIPGAFTLSPDQETEFRQYVVRERVRPVTVRERVIVGATLPGEVELQSIPQALATDLPAARSYRYVTTEAGIAIVNPETRRVVRVIESR